MCGIVGYLGSAQAAPVLISELRCLEYRGYDSAGVAIIEDGNLCVMKAAGKLSNLETLLTQKKPAATVGIGHTRWATHGVPNDQNAHPHMDSTGTIAVVHNGIIENHVELRKWLTEQGYKFNSDTDTEVVAHLVAFEYAKDKDIRSSILRAVKQLKGAYALGIVCQRHPDRIYAVNHHYSLAVGLGEHESFLASDSMAVRQYTNRILKLEQSELAEITAEGAKLYNFDGVEVNRAPVSMESNPYIIDKSGYKHFLLKEIHEQPLVIRRTLGKYLSHPSKPINFSYEHGDGLSYGVKMTENELKGVDRVYIVACGTAYHAGMIGKYLIEELCSIPVEIEIASEIRGRKMLVNERTLTIAVSQSGETADTIAALEEAQRERFLYSGNNKQT